MFDVSFTEMMVIAVVALVVIGPERLPKVARTIGHLLGRAQRYVSDVKSDIRREMELDELRRLRTEMEDAARAVQTTVQGNVDELRKGFDEVGQAFGTLEQGVRDEAAALREAVEAPATVEAPPPPADASVDGLSTGPAPAPAPPVAAAPDDIPAPAPTPAPAGPVPAGPDLFAEAAPDAVPVPAARPDQGSLFDEPSTAPADGGHNGKAP